MFNGKDLALKYLLTVAYNGRRYSGYQFQNNAETVASTLQDGLKKVFGDNITLTGCSRTDAGVHARDFKALVDTGSQIINISTDKIPVAVNSYLPDDISVKNAATVSDDFHPRYSVKSKEYEYLIFNGETRDPFLDGLAYHYPRKLDVAIMNDAAGEFIGTYDFCAFMNSGSDVTDTVRTVYSCSVTRRGDIVSVKICGNGFLYNMVRIIVGTLIAVSNGKIDVKSVKNIIESKDRSKAGTTVPPCGLYLNKVNY